MLNYCDYFLGNFWKNLGYFLIQHLVTLIIGEIRRKRMSVIEDDDEYPMYTCHYVHNSRNLGAAVSNCDGDSYRFISASNWFISSLTGF